MKFFMPMLKLDKLNDEGGGGGMPKPPPATPPAAPITPATPPVEAPGNDDHLDELGYEIAPKEGEATPPVEKKAAAISKDTEPVKEPATGYDKEPAAPVVEPPATPPVVTPPVAQDDLDKALVGLPDIELKKIKDFATLNKITPEQATAYAALRKQEIKDAQDHYEKTQKEFENEKLKTKAEWHKELKNDPDFGGEKFLVNVAKVDKVLEQFLPGLKKSLTERKAMLPPYLMRDLAKLGDHMFGTETLVQGGPKGPDAPVEKSGDEALDWYE